VEAEATLTSFCVVVPVDAHRVLLVDGLEADVLGGGRRQRPCIILICSGVLFGS
jgi:hypothetical protein